MCRKQLKGKAAIRHILLCVYLNQASICMVIIVIVFPVLLINGTTIKQIKLDIIKDT